MMKQKQIRGCQLICCQVLFAWTVATNTVKIFRWITTLIQGCCVEVSVTQAWNRAWFLY